MPAPEYNTLFAEVILPLALQKNYIYRVPQELAKDVQVGKRVIVQFGRYKYYTALVSELQSVPPLGYTAKYLDSVVDKSAIVTASQLAFWRWVADYYMCTLGEVMSAALPSAFKIQSETVIALADDVQEKGELTAKEEAILNALRNEKELTIRNIGELLQQQAVLHIINGLYDRGLISISEKVEEKYKPLTKTFIRFTEFYQDAEHIEHLLGELTKAARQTDAVLSMLAHRRNKEPVSKAVLLEESQCGPAALKALVKKEVLQEYQMEVSRLPVIEDAYELDVKLSAVQGITVKEIAKHFENRKVVLFHGVASSGKTHVFMQLIKQVIAEGGQVLLLLPEIALTSHIVERIKDYFKTGIGVYHSKFNDNERIETYNKVLDGSYNLVVGARSAVFLPFTNLQLIVVDEEHDSSFKQMDPAPRYNGRDCAVYLTKLYDSKALLCSATPSFESYYNAQQGKYGYVSLTERYGNSPQPKKEVIDISAKGPYQLKGSYFSAPLLESIKQTVADKQQVILFQNRRGYATFSICKTCGFSPKCISCDVSLVYHKSSGKLHCHYCGFTQPVLNYCPACRSTHIEQKGYGTERIQEDLALLMPELRILRLDVDTTRTRTELNNILTRFNTGDADVLIGTQMVAKGLDFNNVLLVGVIQADAMLNYPDFRAGEHAFQILTQVAGRAGRRDRQGKVIIQSYNPDNPILQFILRSVYKSFYEYELPERSVNNYPPCSRLVKIFIRHKQEETSSVAAAALTGFLFKVFKQRVLGPVQPYVTRVRNYYIWQVLIKCDAASDYKKIKLSLRESLTEFSAINEFKSVLIHVDVDPI